mgnify:CR=1 FL=1
MSMVLFLVHVITKKGKGYEPAEKSPNKFHGTGPFEIATGKKITIRRLRSLTRKCLVKLWSN